MRRHPNWLRGFADLTTNTEAPAHFWLWGGIFTLSAAIGARCRLNYGIDPLLPNLYICLVARPGAARKGGPPSLAKKMLTQVGGAGLCNLGVDSTTKPSLTLELANCSVPVQTAPGKFEAVSELILISKELSSFFGPDLQNMIEVLTDLFDFHQEWEYKTKNKGRDKIRQPCLNFFAATTPSWLAKNVPYESIGYGWASRVIFVTAKDKKCRITFPEISYGKLFETLVLDLSHIATLRGTFEWSQEARDLFDQWYINLDQKYKETDDERLHDIIERLHIQVLKVAMALRVSVSDELVLDANSMGQAIHLIEDIFPNLTDAFGAYGRNKYSQDIARVMDQFRAHKKLEESWLYKANWRHLTSSEMRGIIELLISMGRVRVMGAKVNGAQMDRTLKWSE